MSVRVVSVLLAALVMAVLVVFYLGLAVPYREALAALEARNAATAAQVTRYRTLARTEEPGPSRNPRLYLPVLSPAQSVALLQRTVQDAAASAGLVIDGVQALPPETEIGRLGLRLRGSGDMAAVASFLHALEASTPVLLLDGLRLHSRAGRSDRRLDLELDVIGFRPEPGA